MLPVPGTARLRLSRLAAQRLLRLGGMSAFPIDVPEQTVLRIGAIDVGSATGGVETPREGKWPGVVQIAFDEALVGRRIDLAPGTRPREIARAWAALLADAIGPGVEVLEVSDVGWRKGGGGPPPGFFGSRERVG